MSNKYFQALKAIVNGGQKQGTKKGGTTSLFNYTLDMSEHDVKIILNEYSVAKKLLTKELVLYMQGVTDVAEYERNGIHWWSYCDSLINSYPDYMKALPGLIKKINKELSDSRNYVLYMGANNVESDQKPCVSLMQFQIRNNELYMTVYQRSADANLGLPSDIFQAYLISQMIDVPLRQLHYTVGNAHIYDSNLELTKEFLKTGVKPKFNLNV